MIDGKNTLYNSNNSRENLGRGVLIVDPKGHRGKETADTTAWNADRNLLYAERNQQKTLKEKCDAGIKPTEAEVATTKARYDAIIGEGEYDKLSSWFGADEAGKVSYAINIILKPE